MDKSNHNMCTRNSPCLKSLECTLKKPCLQQFSTLKSNFKPVCVDSTSVGYCSRKILTKPASNLHF